jgi:hypothetical protein
MTFTEDIENVKTQTPFSDLQDDLCWLENEISQALTLYLQCAREIIADTDITIPEVSPTFFSLRHNFFSTLFLFSYYRTGMEKEFRIFYAAMNQCLRGMVTGCDNLLDDEYKETLPTNLPLTATRFRSVMDIMISDRVLFQLALKMVAEKHLSVETALDICAVSLKALLKSGIEEAKEEDGIGDVLLPAQVLATIHHYKTGLLFQAPWAIPVMLEKGCPTTMNLMQEALYHIGMGCQVLDDIVDLHRDICGCRHNYVRSALHYASDPEARQAIEDIRTCFADLGDGQDLLSLFPQVKSLVLNKALAYLKGGLGALFGEKYCHLITPAILFLFERIGVPVQWLE